MIKIENLSKRFLNNGKEILALDNIGFEIEPKEFVSVVGPSGCGKTTLLNLIGGLEKSTSGRVMLNGKEVTGPGLDRGIFFQESPLFPWKTVLENIELALDAKRIKKENGVLLAKEYLKRMNLLDFVNFYPRELSEGMKQRVALARILVLDPEILLMDEPFGSLDTQTRAIMQEELLKIWQIHKKTILFITHSIDEAIFLSDRIIILSSSPGRIIKIINTNLPRPRRSELKPKKEFSKLRYEIWNIIRNEILKK